MAMKNGGLLLNRSRQVPAEDTAAFAGIAERFRRAGDLDRAITLCREGLKRFPTLLSARVTLGWALLDKGVYDEARAELEQVLRRAPDNLAAIRGLAELHDRTEHMTAMEDAGWQHPPATDAADEHEETGPSLDVEPATGTSVFATVALDEPIRLPRFDTTMSVASGATEADAGPVVYDAAPSESALVVETTAAAAARQALAAAEATRAIQHVGPTVAEAVTAAVGTPAPATLEHEPVSASLAAFEASGSDSEPGSPAPFEPYASARASDFVVDEDSVPPVALAADAPGDLDLGAEPDFAALSTPAPASDDVVTLAEGGEIELDALASAFSDDAIDPHVPAPSVGPAADQVAPQPAVDFASLPQQLIEEFEAFGPETWSSASLPLTADGPAPVAFEAPALATGPAARDWSDFALGSADSADERAGVELPADVAATAATEELPGLEALTGSVLFDVSMRPGVARDTAFGVAAEAVDVGGAASAGLVGDVAHTTDAAHPLDRVVPGEPAVAAASIPAVAEQVAAESGTADEAFVLLDLAAPTAAVGAPFDEPVPPSVSAAVDQEAPTLVELDPARDVIAVVDAASAGAFQIGLGPGELLLSPPGGPADPPALLLDLSSPHPQLVGAALDLPPKANRQGERRNAAVLAALNRFSRQAQARRLELETRSVA